MKSNHWMPLYVADYLTKTTRLTTECHGAYLLLIMDCWQSEAPLPDDDAQLAAITRLPLPRWLKTRQMLAPYFIVAGGLWRHERVEFELSKAAGISAKRSANGRQGAQQTNGKRAAIAAANGSANGQQTGRPLTLEPLTKEESIPPIAPQGGPTTGAAAIGKPKRDRGTRIPDDWEPDEQDREFARTEGLDAGEVAAEFRDYWIAVPGARGRKLDWHSTFRNRCREVAGKGNGRGKQRYGPRRPDSLAEIGADVAEILVRKAERSVPSGEDCAGDYPMPPAYREPRAGRDGSADDGGEPVGGTGGIPVGRGQDGTSRMAAIGEVVADPVGNERSLPLAGGTSPSMAEGDDVELPPFLRRY